MNHSVNQNNAFTDLTGPFFYILLYRKCPSCNAGEHLPAEPPKLNATLRASSASGVFWKLGRVKDVNHCGQLCCQQRNWDLSFSVEEVCYNVECQSEKMSRLKNEANLCKLATCHLFFRSCFNCEIKAGSVGKEEGGEGERGGWGYMMKSLQFYAFDVDLYKKKLSGTNSF